MPRGGVELDVTWLDDLYDIVSTPDLASAYRIPRAWAHFLSAFRA